MVWGKRRNFVHLFDCCTPDSTSLRLKCWSLDLIFSGGSLFLHLSTLKTTRETTKSRIFHALLLNCFYFDILWQLRPLDANNSPQNDVTWCDFLQMKQVGLPLSRSLFRRKHNKFLARASRSRILLSSTCGKVYPRVYTRHPHSTNYNIHSSLNWIKLYF